MSGDAPSLARSLTHVVVVVRDRRLASRKEKSHAHSLSRARVTTKIDFSVIFHRGPIPRTCSTREEIESLSRLATSPAAPGREREICQLCRADGRSTSDREASGTVDWMTREEAGGRAERITSAREGQQRNHRAGSPRILRISWAPAGTTDCRTNRGERRASPAKGRRRAISRLRRRPYPVARIERARRSCCTSGIGTESSVGRTSSIT